MVDLRSAIVQLISKVFLKREFVASQDWVTISYARLKHVLALVRWAAGLQGNFETLRFFFLDIGSGNMRMHADFPFPIVNYKRYATSTHAFGISKARGQGPELVLHFATRTCNLQSTHMRQRLTRRSLVYCILSAPTRCAIFLTESSVLVVLSSTLIMNKVVSLAHDGVSSMEWSISEIPSDQRQNFSHTRGDIRLSLGSCLVTVSEVEELRALQHMATAAKAATHSNKKLQARALSNAIIIRAWPKLTSEHTWGVEIILLVSKKYPMHTAATVTKLPGFKWQNEDSISGARDICRVIECSSYTPLHVIDVTTAIAASRAVSRILHKIGSEHKFMILDSERTLTTAGTMTNSLVTCLPFCGRAILCTCTRYNH